MSAQLFEEDRELTPEEAFILSMDAAVAATVKCLLSAGMDEEAVWAAFRTAIATMYEGAAGVDSTEFNQCHDKLSAAA